jgi:hypothetical protein
MKAIIYAGIGLFSVASVYGVIDYYGAKKQGVLNSLYAEEAPEAVTEVKETKNAAATAVLNNTVAANNPAAAIAKAPVAKTKKAKKEKERRFVKFSDFSRGAIIREDVPAITAAPPLPVPKPEPTVAATPVEQPAAAPAVIPAEKPEEKKEVVEQPVKRPAVNLEMFSRAPLKKRIKKAVQPEKVKQQ